MRLMRGKDISDNTTLNAKRHFAMVQHIQVRWLCLPHAGRPGAAHITGRETLHSTPTHSGSFFGRSENHRQKTFKDGVKFGMKPVTKVVSVGRQLTCPERSLSDWSIPTPVQAHPSMRICCGPPLSGVV